jgi:glyoxylase-like metal-dependent hydrolase (beta-lactamase superfamily II)
MQQWQVGRFTVTQVQEFAVEPGLLDGLVAQASPEVVRGIDWMRPDFANDAGQTLWDVHSYVVDTGDHVVVVDAGCGNGKSYPMQPSWSGLETRFLERLQEAGYGREDVDVVLCTHLHLDHVGWCSMQDDQGRWVPTFPNARLVLVRDEYERHLAQILPPDAGGPAGLGADAAAGVRPGEDGQDDEDEADRIARAFFADAVSLSTQTEFIQQESFEPVLAAGKLELVLPDAEVVTGVRYVPTPGHTSAHASVRLDSDGESAFITGDFIHHPVQIARPEWSSQGDWDGDASARNRRAFLEASAGTDLLVLGTHFTGPGAGWVERDGNGFRLTQTRPPRDARGHRQQSAVDRDLVR